MPTADATSFSRSRGSLPRALGQFCWRNARQAAVQRLAGLAVFGSGAWAADRALRRLWPDLMTVNP